MKVTKLISAAASPLVRASETIASRSAFGGASHSVKDFYTLARSQRPFAQTKNTNPLTLPCESKRSIFTGAEAAGLALGLGVPVGGAIGLFVKEIWEHETNFLPILLGLAGAALAYDYFAEYTEDRIGKEIEKLLAKPLKQINTLDEKASDKQSKAIVEWANKTFADDATPLASAFYALKAEVAQLKKADGLLDKLINSEDVSEENKQNYIQKQAVITTTFGVADVLFEILRKHPDFEKQYTMYMERKAQESREEAARQAKKNADTADLFLIFWLLSSGGGSSKR